MGTGGATPVDSCGQVQGFWGFLKLRVKDFLPFWIFCSPPTFDSKILGFLFCFVFKVAAPKETQECSARRTLKTRVGPTDNTNNSNNTYNTNNTNDTNNTNNT